MDIIPSAPPPKQSAASQASALDGVAVKQAPTGLTAPRAPVQVSGTVTASNPQTQEVTIRTPQGLVTVQSATPLPPETPVTLRVYTDRMKTLADITILKQARAEQASLENMVTTAQKPPAPLPPLKAGDTIIALILPKNTSAPPAVTPQPTTLPEEGAPPGIIQRLLSAYLPSSSAPTAAPSGLPPLPGMADNDILQTLHALQTPAKAAPPGGAPAATAPPSAAGPAPVFTPPLLASLLTQNTAAESSSSLTAFLKNLMPQVFAAPAHEPLLKNLYKIDIVRVMPPEATPQDVDAALQKEPGLAAAKVETSTPKGFPLLGDNDNMFILRSPATVAPGSTVIYKATPATTAEAGAPQTPAAPQTLDPRQATAWSALEETLLELGRIDHPAARTAAQAVQASLPAPTAQLAPTALFFLAALRTGMVENWLGANTLQTLRQAGKADLVKRLSGDFEKLSLQAKEQLPGEWRAISLPLRHDGQLSQIHLYTRQQGDDEREDGANGGKPATRFILNLSLSRMGAMQLDGFIQKKSFDMVLRTEDKLPFDMRQEIMKKFAAGLDHVQMQGGISFQTRAESWMTPEAGAAKSREA